MSGVWISRCLGIWGVARVRNERGENIGVEVRKWKWYIVKHVVTCALDKRLYRTSFNPFQACPYRSCEIIIPPTNAHHTSPAICSYNKSNIWYYMTCSNVLHRDNQEGCKWRRTRIELNLIVCDLSVTLIYGAFIDFSLVISNVRILVYNFEGMWGEKSVYFPNFCVPFWGNSIFSTL